MSHAYGKDIVHKVRAFAGDEPIAIHSIVNARIYEDAPTDEQKQDSSAVLGGFTGAAKTAWTTSDPTNLIYTVTFDALDDLEPLSNLLYDTWHPVVNVRLQASEQVGFLYKPILVWRVMPQFSQMDVDYDDVYAIEDEIQDVFGNTKTTTKINVAKTRVLNRIRSLGLDRHRLQEVDLGEAVTYKAAALALWDMSTDENNYGEKAAKWDELYEAIWSALKPGYDADDDGDVEPEEKATTFKPMWQVF